MWKGRGGGGSRRLAVTTMAYRFMLLWNAAAPDFHSWGGGCIQKARDDDVVAISLVLSPVVSLCCDVRHAMFVWIRAVVGDCLF